MVTSSASCIFHRGGGIVRAAYATSSRVIFENGKHWQHVPRNVIQEAKPGCQLGRTTAPFGYHVDGKHVNGLKGVFGMAIQVLKIFVIVGAVFGLISPLFKDKEIKSETQHAS
jgi:hypothetical protein